MINRSMPLVTGVLILSFYIASFLGLQSSRHELNIQGQESPLFNLPTVMTQVIAGEFKGLLADYAVMEVGSIIGKKEKVTLEEWKTVARLFDHALELDPYFQQSYMLLQGTLPWYTKDYDVTIALLETSKDHRYWDWIPGFFIGFDYFYFVKDNLKASEHLMEASNVKDAPPALVTFGARLAQQSGKNETAISFLRTMLEKEKDQDKRDMLMKRIDVHLALDILETGITAYRNKLGKNPDKLDDLVSAGILAKLPDNPYGYPFGYDPESGNLKF
jgi:hypothetical protein